MDSCLQIQDTNLARVELAYIDYKSIALTSKLLKSCCTYLLPKQDVCPSGQLPRHVLYHFELQSHNWD